MSVGRLLSSFNLTSSTISKLLDADFLYNTDVKDLDPSELSKACGLDAKESAEIIRVISQPASIRLFTAMEIVEQDQCEVTHIVTFCKALDDLLGGGIQLGTVIDVSGTPGVGKTQLCLQACVSVQLPVSVDGVCGEALFIDTEGNFSVKRLREIASHAVSHLNSIDQRDGDALEFTVDSICRNIHYFRCENCVELMAVLKHLPVLLQKNPKIKLVVVDSITFHFRYGILDMKLRARLLFCSTEELVKLAAKHRMAVLMTNHSFIRSNTDGSLQLVAALGDMWGHCPQIRMMLSWDCEVRVATLTKAPHRSTASAKYQVTVAGIRDVIANEVPSVSSQED